MSKRIAYQLAFRIDAEVAAYIHLTMDTACEDEETLINPKIKELVSNGGFAKAVQEMDPILDNEGYFDVAAAVLYLDTLMTAREFYGPAENVSFTRLYPGREGTETVKGETVACLLPSFDTKGQIPDFPSLDTFIEAMKLELAVRLSEPSLSLFPDNFDWQSKVVSVVGTISDKSLVSD